MPRLFSLRRTAALLTLALLSISAVAEPFPAAESFVAPMRSVIAISGRGVDIAPGDTTPAAADDTDFGATPLFYGLSPWGAGHTFTITNRGGAVLNLTRTPKVTISGLNAADFSVAKYTFFLTYPPIDFIPPYYIPPPQINFLGPAFPASPVAAGGGTTTFSILFQPSAAGLRTATVTVESDDPDQGSYTFAIQGLGAVSPSSAVGLSYVQPNHLVHFDAVGATMGVGHVSISGVAAGERLVALDTRPATGALLAFGIDSVKNQGTLYTLDPSTGLATPIGTPGSVAFLDRNGSRVLFPPFPTTRYDLAVDAVADEVRVVTSDRLNFRVNPTSGLPVDGDYYEAPGGVIGLNPDGDIHSTFSGPAVGVAYSNAVIGAAVSTCYTIQEFSRGPAHGLVLCYENPPNRGTTQFVRDLSLNGSALLGRLVLGFDLPSNVAAPASNQPAASGYGYFIAATPSLNDSEVMRVDLATGAVTAVKPLGEMVFSPALLSTPPEPALLSGPTLRNVTDRRATIGGNVTSDAGTGYIDAGVLIAKTADNADPRLGGANVTVQHVSGSLGAFAYTVAGLLPETQYSYRVFARNSVVEPEITYSVSRTFTTTKAPEFEGEADYVISAGGARRIFPLRNDLAPTGRRLVLMGVNDLNIGVDGQSLLIPEGYTGSFTYYFTDGTKLGQGTVLVTSARPATVYSGLLRDQSDAVMGSAHVAFAPGLRTATVLLKVRTSELRLLVAFPPNNPIASRQTKFGMLYVATNDDGRVVVDLIPEPNDGRLLGNLQARHAPGPRARYNVALITTDPSKSGGGFGFLTVLPDSGVMMTAVLPDGTVFTTASSLRQDNVIPIFSRAGPAAPLAIAGGDLVLADLAASDFTGSWIWRKPQQSPGVPGLYLGGVDTRLDVTGCRYAGELGVNGGASLGIDGGDLAPQLEQGDGVLVTDGRPTLPVGILQSWIAYRRDGIFLAGLKIPGRGNVLGRGVYLPKSQTAWGVFPGTTVGGRIVLSVP